MVAQETLLGEALLVKGVKAWGEAKECLPPPPNELRDPNPEANPLGGFNPSLMRAVPAVQSRSGSSQGRSVKPRVLLLCRVHKAGVLLCRTQSSQRESSGISSHNSTNFPSGRIFHEWNRFDPDSLKQKQLICCCNMFGVQYELGGDIRKSLKEPRSTTRNHLTVCRWYSSSQHNSETNHNTVQTLTFWLRRNVKSVKKRLRHISKKLNI